MYKPKSLMINKDINTHTLFISYYIFLFSFPFFFVSFRSTNSFNEKDVCIIHPTKLAYPLSDYGHGGHRPRFDADIQSKHTK